MEQQRTLEEILTYVLANEIQFTTPKLTNVVSYENKILIKIENVNALTAFAAKALYPALQHLTIDPVRVIPLHRAKTSDRKRIELKTIINVFLNGVQSTGNWGKYMSVAVKFFLDDRSPVKQTQEAIVSFFLRSPKHKSVQHYRKHYRHVIAESKERFFGIHKFISKSHLEEFISEDGAVTFSLSIIFV